MMTMGFSFFFWWNWSTDNRVVKDTMFIDQTWFAGRYSTVSVFVNPRNAMGEGECFSLPCFRFKIILQILIYSNLEWFIQKINESLNTRKPIMPQSFRYTFQFSNQNQQWPSRIQYYNRRPVLWCTSGLNCGKSYASVVAHVSELFDVLAMMIDDEELLLTFW